MTYCEFCSPRPCHCAYLPGAPAIKTDKAASIKNADIKPQFKRMAIIEADNGWIVRTPDKRILFTNWHALFEWQLKYIGPKEVRDV